MITSDTGGDVYLKVESFADYEKTSARFLKAPQYLEKLQGERSAYYLLPYALKNAMLDTSTLIVEPKEGIFAIPYYTESGGGIQSSDVIMSGDASSKYTVHYYSWSGTSGIVLPEEYRAYEESYRNFVMQNYLTIDDETLAFMNGIIASEGFTNDDAE